MKSRNIILSGALLAILVAMLTFSSAPIALAGYTDTGATPTPDLQVYLLKKAFAICENELQGSGFMIGDSDGMVPPSGQQFGCVETGYNDRLNEYLFTGEQMAVLVAVRDVQGAAAIATPVYLDVGGQDKVQCTDITSASHDLKEEGLKWYGHDVSTDLHQQPPGISAGTENGFDFRFDRLYSCVYQATSEDSGSTAITVDVMDVMGNVPSVNTAIDFVYFNPEILVDVTTSNGEPLSFAPGSSSPDYDKVYVYSTNTLMITNEAQGGVVLYGWLAGTDLTSSTGGALCPVNNVLNVADNMMYRCKVGTIFNNKWTSIPHPDDTQGCQLDMCEGALPLLNDNDYQSMSLLTVGSTAECWFRLHYPLPCIGSFDGGQILVFARAI